MKEDVKDIIERYNKKLEGEFNEGALENFSREYIQFKEEQDSKKLSFYENMCNFCELILKIRVNKEKRIELVRSIDRLELEITPEGANSFAFFTGLGLIIIGILIWAIGFFIFDKFLLFFPFLFAILGLLSIYLLAGKPNRMALKIRLKAENNMVLCILYVIMYMRHTSNLEHAIKFAAIHIDEPLSKDLKLIFWNLETGRYSTLKESLDTYLESWRGYSMDFISSFHLIESSLYETTEARRLDILEKALKTMLDGTYERMLHYAQELKSPVTTLYMLGVILPILGLVVLPLMGAFLGVKWYWLAFVYNLVLPIFVYYYGNNLLVKRPAGESEASSVIEKEFEEYKYVNIFNIKVDPLLIAIPILVVILLIGFSPVILHYFISDANVLNQDSYFGYRKTNEEYLGPFGISALFISFLIPLGLGIGLGTYYKLKTRKLIEIRNNSRELEKEFSASLFQLGNRIEDGLPAELAFGKVAETMEGTATGDFFRIVSVNLRRLGISLRDSIFNKKVGALVKYPSKVIQSSMEILIESAKKGPKVAAHSLISISNYMANIHSVNERLKDLLSDVLSSMKGQINFLTPLIIGIVIGISTMITNIIVNLGPILEAGTGNNAVLGLDVSVISEVFPIDKVMPPFFLQLVVGLYLVEITFILTVLSNAIEHGFDNLAEENSLGKNLYKGVIFYVIVAVIVTLILTFMARGIMTMSGTQGL